MKTLAFNPYLPSYEYVPDGEPYVFGDRLYVFGSHDRFNGEDFCINDYVCWSAPIDDLGDWRNEGVIYKATQDPLNVDGSQYLFAPDVQQGEDGRYYLYYCLHRSPSVSVAVCDTPAGTYEFYGHVKYEDGTVYGNKKPKDVFNFDPGVLRNKEGHLYLYTGFSVAAGMMRNMMGQAYHIDGSYCVELEQDMITIKSEPKLVAPCEEIAAGTGFEGHGFYEASSPRQIGDQYYMIYSSVKSHDLCYATCDTPDGMYQYGGVIVSNSDIGLVEESKARNYFSNTHGGLVEVQGKWYVFYHRHTNGHRYSRQGCAEEIRILEDGSIPQVEMTSCGLNQEPLPGTGTYEARIACNLAGKDGAIAYEKDKWEDHKHPYFTQSGADRENDGDQYIANMHDGAWAGFKYFTFNQEKQITVSVRGTGLGILEVRTERKDTPIAKIDITPSDSWKEFVAEFSPKEGVKALYVTYQGPGYIDFAKMRIN